MQNEQWASYVERFNANDEELTVQAVSNAQALAWMEAEVPRFECPDRTLEETYYFRWWVFRKHIKDTPEGRIITEFLPTVPWAGAYNSINCAAGHHLAEARWLRGDQRLANEYIRFWFQGSGDVFSYSSWIVDAVYQHALVTGDASLAKELFPRLRAYYETMEADHMTRYGLFWSYDDRDAMEMSISGSGLRPTLNSYMYANALALSRIAQWCGEPETRDQYAEKAATLRARMLDTLWDEGGSFFKVIPQVDRDAPIASLSFADIPAARNVRESIGFIPWSFGIPEARHGAAWQSLRDPQGFLAPYGPTTAERTHPGFMQPCENHECLWNGPSWPFSTTQVLNGMITVLQQGDAAVSREDFLSTLSRYAVSHYRRRADGAVVNWLDENLEPDTGRWLSRSILENWGWPEEKAGRERGKDYNHSAFCDLLIRGICGVQIATDNTLHLNPLVPPGVWDYFLLQDLPYKGHRVTIGYDVDGSRYGKSSGLWVQVDGKSIAARRSDFGSLDVPLE